MTSNIFVTEGAGYIGSHICKQLFRAGFCPITFDNLSRGNKDAVKATQLNLSPIRQKQEI